MLAALVFSLLHRLRRNRFSIVSLAVLLLASRAVTAQPMQTRAASTNQGSAPDLQGLWDFSMRMGERTSPGFFALGPLEKGWGGSITMYLTNTLAIRELVVKGDSIRMVVASREGDVRYLARLTNDGRSMEGIVEYHGGVLVPMTAVRRLQPVAPRLD